MTANEEYRPLDGSVTPPEPEPEDEHGETLDYVRGQRDALEQVVAILIAERGTQHEYQRDTIETD